MPARKYRVAVIRGDGIGPELVDSALTVLDAVADFPIELIEVHGGAGTYRTEGSAMTGQGGR
ncbi:isocitrate/isopropylmalate family dehydrogenase [Saccharopolyspora sp. K220]|uniref:isocitrate/isopropylmalate family dehydrogenase n=1 Tax=Saccharopolyspora soli TaxID=2926618 RepID=UPI001F55E5B0|nr:isocitrate/isopropylmalate family dehydrogenase [Saccharopolyspora soli]MCI2423864.1 isocitrate/isopropylmalate family dehydrogenase [Saccharopolyspora soli]